MENQNQNQLPKNPEEDKDLEKIRYFKSTWDDFFNFWKKRGVETDPYKGTILKYPKDKIQKDSTLPYQDFGTFAKSKENKLMESFSQFIESI
jgi:hypothetical protein